MIDERTDSDNRFGKCYHCKNMVSANELFDVVVYAHSNSPTVRVEICNKCWESLIGPTPNQPSLMRTVFDYAIKLLRIKRCGHE